MALLFALHTIHHKVGDDIKVQLPNELFTIDDAHVEDLKKAGAARDPSADEMKLHKLANGDFGAAAAKKSAEEDSKSADDDIG